MKEHEFQGKPGEGCTYVHGTLPCRYVEDAPVHAVMTVAHEQHLAIIKESFMREVDAKYRAGVRQHGGKLWTKPGLIEKALEECVDQYVFLRTLLMQRDNPAIIDPNAKDIDA